jgi:uncharacterized protein
MSNASAEQMTQLEGILNTSESIQYILSETPKLKLPNWYLGAGAVAQTVWNQLNGYPLDTGIKDCDLVYYDEDISSTAQERHLLGAQTLFANLPLEIDVTNEARVHLWYEQQFGKKIKPYKSTEDAIDTWPTTATSVGVRYDDNDFKVYAPFGLDDLLGMIVRPNKVQITQDVYDKKVERWLAVWPKLTVIPWNS